MIDLLNWIEAHKETAFYIGFFLCVVIVWKR